MPRAANALLHARGFLKICVYRRLRRLAFHDRLGHVRHNERSALIIDLDVQRDQAVFFASFFKARDRHFSGEGIPRVNGLQPLGFRGFSRKNTYLNRIEDGQPFIK